MHSLLDEWGHWDAQATMTLVIERFWWPSFQKDAARYVKTCDACQRVRGIATFWMTLSIPQSWLFEVFSIDFSGPFPTTVNGNRFIIVCLEHLTDWPIVERAKRSTVDVVIDFIKAKILPCFEAPGIIVSDNGSCFTAEIVQTFMKEYGTEWRTVLAYAPRSNGRAEKMDGTVKRSIGRIVNEIGHSSDRVVADVLFGYR